jgi:hypothetical protein
VLGATPGSGLWIGHISVLMIRDIDLLASAAAAERARARASMLSSPRPTGSGELRDYIEGFVSNKVGAPVLPAHRSVTALLSLPRGWRISEKQGRRHRWHSMLNMLDHSAQCAKETGSRIMRSGFAFFRAKSEAKMDQ